jgi:general secretion pathway protein F
LAVFSYRATTQEGAIVEGVIEASDETSAVERLKNSGVIPLRVAASGAAGKKRISFTFRVRGGKDSVLTFTTELSALLGAGLPLDRSLNILSEISDSREMKAVIMAILRDIREGNSFSDALRKHPHLFPNIYVNMIKAGEAGGVLGIVLDELNAFLESSKELRESVVSAMIYPSILVMTGGLSIIVLLTYILPRFSVIFDEMGGALPLSTKMLLAFSGFLKSYWWVIFLAAVAAGILFRSAMRTEQGRFRWDAFKLRLTGRSSEA